ncbi:uncharacterized protein LOC128128400 [Lactuca sativa]|uniref:uncharacterized protein LOC128128400 n=1 Tax=Lactuca sativa TaxID=4236 RepID=UPI0022AEB1F9|nr:uncharacterized protein LOC128128400 [Lactuca sativa]
MDLEAYTARFNDLALLCPAMVTPEEKKQLIDHRASRGTTVAATNQAKGGNNKRKFWNLKKKQPMRDPAKKQRTVAVRAATIAPAPAPPKPYAGILPKCNKCNYHHKGACRELHCKNCDKKGHTARFCRAPARPNNQVANAGASQTCYECGEAGHFRRNCPKAQTPNGDGVGRVLTMGHGEAVKDPSVVSD